MAGQHGSTDARNGTEAGGWTIRIMTADGMAERKTVRGLDEEAARELIRPVQAIGYHVNIVPESRYIEAWYDVLADGEQLTKEAPVHCDLCPKEIPVGQIVTDGKTTRGPWGFMCKGCFPVHGVGLGLGRGQQYLVVAARA